ncbi:MAG: type III pantothenate kinase [Phycisphaerales bacterium]|nr:type III pantothenate kinase [Phycisphaerales bacterium]
MSRILPADSLVVIDVGNSRIGIGVSEDGTLRGVKRFDADAADDWRAGLREAWKSTDGARSRAIVIASVAPLHDRRVFVAAADDLGEEPLRIRDDVPFPMPLKIDNADEIGVDRVCSAAAAWDRVREPCAIASFGTAITIDCVSAEGEFLGGTILPGIEMSLGALHDRTAQLPRVELKAPPGPFGKNTHDAIRAGVVFGAVGALREIVERFATDLRSWPQLILTGGNARLVAELTDIADAVVPDLCLMGIALSHRSAAGAARA